ncbi:MAG: ATP-binding cassette domain-containing protein, partial [Tumebacillaceae bacterium]
MADNGSFLAVDGVSVHFFDQKTPVLQDMTLSIREKESVLLLGPSGCGKSTLLQVLSGIIPKSIEAWMKGTVTKPDRVGVMFQDPDAQFCMLTVEDEIAFSLENRMIAPAEMRERIERLMKDVRLDVPLRTAINDLSGGLKQRLALACLLALEPDVLFFDEPTAQLDPENTQQVLADIRKLHGHKTLVLIEHKLDGVIDWVDRVLLFGPDGTLLADGAPHDVLREKADLMREYGIWQPRLWPVTWEELLDHPEHPLARKLEAQVADAEERTVQVGKQLPHSEPILDVRDAAMRYKNGKRVWSDVNVTVTPSEWVAIVGPNGAGKSTFLKAVGGLLPLSEGQVLFQGKKLASYKTEVL